MCEQIDWFNLHGEGWGKLLVPEAYAHPAKVKRALARKIYVHLFERGYIEQGAIIVDPFAGIGGFALHAMQSGLHFIGMELEQPFVDLGQSCDCTGVSKENWIRYQGRLDKVRYRDGRHICPRCIAEAGRVLPSLDGQTEMFGPAQTTSYRRNSGKVPRTDPHHYSGNIETWTDLELPGTARIVQGDSRNLAALLEGVGGLVSSPPWQQGQCFQDKEFILRDNRPNRKGTDWEIKAISERPASGYIDGYGTSPGQLAAMPPGSHAAVVSSPPHLDTLASDDPDRRGGLFRDPKRRNDKTLTAEYGRTPGQLGVMRPGDISIVSSPPFQESLSGKGKCPELRPDGTPFGQGASIDLADYGTTPGQLGAMRPGDVSIISSPPYTTNTVHGNSGIDATKFAEPDRAGHNTQATAMTDYGDNDGQLANLPVGDAIVSSPPFEKTLGKGGETKGFHSYDKDEAYNRCKRDYIEPAANGQLGQETGTTFWQAAKTIMEQCYQVLAPGAVAVWTLKAFVRDKAIVDFPAQWQALGESCGFTTTEVIRAHLVEDRGTQFDLWGKAEKREVKRMSFFRRLHAQKFPHLSIDYEVVLIQRKT